MDIRNFIEALEVLGIDTIAGVPDSQLKVFCDYLTNSTHHFNHYTPANEGNAVALAAGSYLANGRPSCVYMQNSGLGNAVNPITSLITKDVYDIPMLFVVGHRGQPGTKDEPQHQFQGSITYEMLELLEIDYATISSKTSTETFAAIVDDIKSAFILNKQYAVVIEKNAFIKNEKYQYQNQYQLNREQVISKLLQSVKPEDIIVSTTGKISREVYEQSKILGIKNGQSFLCVGSMGHASMIALAQAKHHPDVRVICIDGDGATLMHLGSLPFIAAQKVNNFVHVILNNQSHESVGGMRTGAKNADYASIAKSSEYPYTIRIDNKKDLERACKQINQQQNLLLLEIMVSLESRCDLGRPKETPIENKIEFMKYHGVKK